MLINAGNANCATRTGDAVALATLQGRRETAASFRCRRCCLRPPASSAWSWRRARSPRRCRAWWRVSRRDGFDRVARAIMTTDLVPKTAFAEARLRRGAIRVAGMTKGSGMIQPHDGDHAGLSS